MSCIGRYASKEQSSSETSPITIGQGATCRGIWFFITAMRTLNLSYFFFYGLKLHLKTLSRRASGAASFDE